MSFSFLPPNITNIIKIPPPRSCIPRVETCLSHLELENKTSKSMDERNYTNVVRECQSGLLDLVHSVGGVVYRNSACATCNGEGVTECFELQMEYTYGSQDECGSQEAKEQETTDLTTEMPSTEMPTTEMPTTEMPTTEMPTTEMPTTEMPTTEMPAMTTDVSTERNLTLEIIKYLNLTLFNVTLLPMVKPITVNFTLLPMVKPVTINFTQVSVEIDELPITCSVEFSFTITLSNLGDGQIAVSSNDETAHVSITCPPGKIAMGAQCLLTQCPEGYSKTGGRCSYASPSFQGFNSTSFHCPSRITVVDNDSYIDIGNATIILKDGGLTVRVLEYDDLGHPIICQPYDTIYLNCTSELVVLNRSDYKVLGNGSILFGHRVVKDRFHNKDGSPLICPDLITLNNAPYGLLTTLPGIQALTYIGCSLSILGSIAVLLTYSIFSELQTFPGLVLMNLCVPIFATNSLFIIGGPVIQYHPLKQICSTLAIVLHYFYLSQFSWMGIFSFEMTKTFYKARKLVQDSRQEKCKYLAIYLTIGWIFPLVISTITIIVNFTTDGLVLYGVNSQGQIAGCWINHYQSFIIAFVLPLVLSLSCNLILFIITTVLLWRAYKDQAKVDKSNIFTMVRVWLAIFTITGLTWIFGFLAILHDLSWMWYLFVIFNSTQGFSIFLTFIFTKKVFNLYKMLTRKKLKAKLFFSHETGMSGSAELSQKIKLQAV